MAELARIRRRSAARRARLRRFAALALLALAAAAGPALAGTVSITVDASADGQVGPVGSLLPIPYTATNIGGVDAAVTWRIASDATGGATFELAGDALADPTLAGARLSPGESAGPRLRLGPVPGGVGMQVCTSFDAEFFNCDFIVAQPSATADIVPNFVLDPITPSPINAIVGQPFQVQLQVLADGIPVQGQPVQVFAESPPLTPALQSVDSDAQGFVTATLTATEAGSFVGIFSVLLDPDTLTPGDEIEVLYDVDATAAVVRELERAPTDSGDGQSGELGQQLALPLRALALDDGMPAPGVTVLWSTAGDAQLGTSAGPTDTAGIAETTVTLGQTPGPITITAMRSDAPGVATNFTVNALAPLQSLDKAPDSGDQQTGAPGEQLPLPLAVIARDGGIEAPGVPIAWSLRSGNASIQPSASTTGTDGRAEAIVTLGGTGAIVIRASRLDSGDFEDFSLQGRSRDRLELVSGNRQSGEPGSTARLPLLVRLLSDDLPRAGGTVRFTVVQGDASVEPAAVTTDGNGLAATSLAFGDSPGAVRVQAASDGVASVFFDATTLDPGTQPPPPPDRPALLRVVSGDGQRGPVQTVADDPVLLEVVDADDQPVAGVVIDLAVASGDATVDPLQALTDADGRIRVTLRFGAAAGAIRVDATASGGALAASFGAESFLPELRIAGGNLQQGPVSAELPLPLEIEVLDPATKSLAMIPVHWTVQAGGGALATASTSTDAAGRSANRLVLGPEPGPNIVAARLGDTGLQVEFEATGVRDPDELVKIAGDGQTLPTRIASAPLVVELRDASGAPVPGVTLDVSGDNAEASAETVVTGEDGRASVTARVMLPGAAGVRFAVADQPTIAAVFAINGGVANTAGLDDEQREVAGAIDQLCPALLALEQRTPEQEDLLARCLELVDNAGDNPDDVGDALEQLGSDIALSQAHAARLAATAQFDNLKTRIAALRSGTRGADFGGLAIAGPGGLLPLSMFPGLSVDDETPADAPAIGADFGKWGFFASGTIGRGEAEAAGARPEYDFDTAGLTAGVDYRYSDSAVFGLALGLTRQDTELAGGRGSVDTDGWSLSAYGTWFNADSWYLDGVLTWGSNSYDIERVVSYDIRGASGAITGISQTARADHDGDQLSGALSFGRDFQRGAWSLGPYLRATWTRVEFDAYREELQSGLPGSGLGLAVEERELESRTMVLGGKVAYTASRDWGVLIPHLSLEWEHELEDDAASVVARFLHDPTATAMRFPGERLDSDTANLGIGLSAIFPGGKSGFLYYEHLLGADDIDQGSLAIGLRIEF